MFEMTVLEAVRSRRSVRTFDGAALRPEDAQKLMECAGKADNPYEIPIVWKLLDAKEHGLNSPVIVGTDSFVAGKLRRVPHAEEAFGYSFEKVVLYAESLGLGTTWIAGTMNRSAFEQAMELSGDEVMPCVSPIGYPAKKMSVRETMMRKGVKADSRMAFGELFFDGSLDRPLTKDGAGSLFEALEAVRLAPSAVNKQPWRVVVCGRKVHFYEKQSKGYVSDNGWDLQKIDLGIALCHFALISKECGQDAAMEILDPEMTVPENVQYIATFVLK